MLESNNLNRCLTMNSIILWMKIRILLRESGVDLDV